MAARWYFGWNIVAAAAFLTLLSSGMRLSFGPFFLPMAHDLGFSRSLLATIVAVGMLTYGLAMPVAGWLIARYGTRTVLLAGNVRRVKAPAKPTSVERQPKASIATLSTGVITAMPAIDPVDRKNSRL